MYWAVSGAFLHNLNLRTNVVVLVSMDLVFNACSYVIINASVLPFNLAFFIFHAFTCSQCV